MSKRIHNPVADIMEIEEYSEPMPMAIHVAIGTSSEVGTILLTKTTI